jgi:uroporphyrin-III C-methyltransferase/precorrin-2 dehydrogenase/sirohydrochlorin ferrochelatase
VDFLPVFMKVENRPCLVVGGGEVAARKVSLLRRAGGKVAVVAPELCPELVRLAQQQAISYVQRGFIECDVEGQVLVIAATSRPDVNRHISEIAKASGIPVNVVDSPELCSFIMPSMIDRSPVQIAVSTGGASPVLARLLRARLESSIPAAYGRLATLVEGFRDQVKGKFGDPDNRRRFWEELLQGHIAELVLAGREDEAREALQNELDLANEHAGRIGEVYLVGAGPGDPDLITFRALRLMQRADVVVYDRLVAPPILDLVRRDAEQIYAGKERNKHTLSQESINHLLVRLAKEGKRVLRLKGGDPFIFGRGGEEIETLMDEGIPFQVVPGITAASGCASYAGIPLTHRDYAQACIFVTGHLKDGSIDIDWDKLARPAQTIVFYMGLHGVGIICGKLIEHGMPSGTPVALVQQGTTSNQKIYIGTLDTLPHTVEQVDIQPPTLIIIGDVVRLHKKLRWFEPEKKIYTATARQYGM